MAGSRKGYPRWINRRVLDKGISYASIDYRLSGIALSPAQFHDSAMAVQYLRLNSEKYNIDPTRIAATGESAGAGIALWLGLHDDLADPENKDPLKRQSTRVQCVGVTNCQTSYDPLWIRDNIGGDAWKHPALVKLFGVKQEDFDTEAAKTRFAEASTIMHLTKDDAPAHLNYEGMLEGNIHSSKFGLILQEKMDALGLECIVQVKGRPIGSKTSSSEGQLGFLLRHLLKEK